MKITMVEIEATAEDLKASRTLSDALTGVLTRIYDGLNEYLCGYGGTDEEEEDEAEGETDGR